MEATTERTPVAVGEPIPTPPEAIAAQAPAEIVTRAPSSRVICADDFDRGHEMILPERANPHAR